MHSLVQTVLDLSRAHSVEDIAAVVRRGARALTGADGATFILKDGDQCHYLDEDAIEPLWKGRRFPAASCVSGWCMEHRQVAAIEDIYQDPRIPYDAYRPTFVKSLVIVPIRSSDPIGAIGNYWAKPHKATAEEIEVLQALADSASIAMENAYLHASMRRQVDERTRELRLAREQADNANAMKSRFLAAASHNLRQPIQTLNALLAILRRTRKDDESDAYLEAMTQAVHNMESMLGTLLDLHRLEAGAIEPQRQDTTLDGVLAHLRSEFTYVASAKSLSLEIPQAVPAVHTDPHLLQEILRNFISNAIKYTPTGSVRLEHREDGNAVIITVADTGPGIPPPYLKRIFEAFYRTPDAVIGDANDGLGLGLSIAEQLARILGHALEVDSRPGGGSRFSIVVPRARVNVVAAEPAVAASPVQAGQPATARVLYVEDDPGVRESLRMLLRIEGYQVAVASSAGEALKLVSSTGFDPQIIISDLHLPGGETGEEVVSGVRTLLGHPIPALLLTGETRDIKAPAISAVADRVLHKPIDANALLDEVATLVSRA
jgi:signal transduction histidine kinase/CheY-like chemotaxis protein